MELAKLTGELEDNYIGIRMRTTEGYMAAVMTSGNNPLPSQKWITDNKDKFLAVVDLTGSIKNPIPVVVGFYPVIGADSSKYNSLERILTAFTTLVDQLNTAKINTQLGPQGFLPDTLQVLNDLKTELSSISDNIQPLKL